MDCLGESGVSLLNLIKHYLCAIYKIEVIMGIVSMGKNEWLMKWDLCSCLRGDLFIFMYKSSQ